MEEDRQSRASEKKKQRKRRFISSSTKARGTNCSPDYIHSRGHTNTWTAELDKEGGETERSFKNKDRRINKKIARELFPSKNESHESNMGITQGAVLDNAQWQGGWYSDDEGDRLEDIDDEQHQIEGYSSEDDKDSLFRLTNEEPSEGVKCCFNFDDTSSHMMVLYRGQRFRDVSQFRKVVQVYAVREGFNLCVMENRSHIVCCECSDLRCDWVIQGTRDEKGMTFVVTKFLPEHKCNRLPQQFQLLSKWIAAMYLHRWKQQPHISTAELQDEIEATYGIVCPEWKLNRAANRAKHILGMDNDDEYAMLNQLKEEMERIDRHNIVLLETNLVESEGRKRFKRMFVCCDRTSYAFKNHCRGLLAVDGWKINNNYNSVMLVAAELDGNNGILPIAFCEVDVEDLDSWVYFLQNINTALRLDSGKGLCILGDGDNGIDYAVEEYLPRAAYRQCCRKVFSEMVKRFPTAPVQHLFWSACRSTTAAAFHNYMDLISHQSEECHEWLLQSNWKSWALHSMPEWVKCTCVTLTITDRLRNYLHKYLDMSIGRRYAVIVRLMAEIFEKRRMEVWKWYRQKVTPAVRDIIHDRCIDGQRFVIVEQNGTTMKLTDTSSSFYDLNMDSMSCSCQTWQISGIPCAHACKGIKLNMGNVEDYVDHTFSVQNFCSTYAPGMMQLPKEHAWKWHLVHVLLPPMTQTMKGESANCSNDIVPNQVIQHTDVGSRSYENNTQWSQHNTVTGFGEHRDWPSMTSTSSEDSISL